MANTKVIKQKIKAITSIKKITKTMEMVSFAKMKKSSQDTIRISPYIAESKKLVTSVLAEVSGEHPLFTVNPKPTNEVILIFASNKGLCGSFNSNVYKKTKKYIEENKNITKAICFGKFADKIAKRLGLNVEMSFNEIDKITSPLQLLQVEKNLRAMFLQNTYHKVHASYTNFVKNGVYENRVVTLYPVNRNLSTYSDQFEAQEASGSYQVLTFEPGGTQILDNLIPKLVRLILFSFVLESRASEHSMRSFAMKRANESAGELLDTLKLKYNRVRQDGITQEIAEISAGSVV